MKSKAWIVLLGVMLCCLFTIRYLSEASQPVVASINLQEALSDDRGEFAKVTPGRTFEFPRDHGEHPEYKTEWWYFTGNLQDNDGNRYGYQLTLFRVGLNKNELSANPSRWSTNNLLMGHLALSDVKNGEFRSFERFARRSLGLAGVEPDGRRIWLENWEIERRDGGWLLSAQADDVKLDLELTDAKPPVLQGDRGYSRKGPKPEHASYYVSQTRLNSSGTVSFDEKSRQVDGTSWFDHEWSSEAMAEGLAGWDWFSLQLGDGTELMLYLLRYEDGRIEPASSGSFVSQDGEKTELKLSDFDVETLERYKSNRGVEYPSRWRVKVPSQNLSLEVEPFLADQEMTSGVPYWEGAVRVTGSRGGQPLEGVGFVEMTGY